MISNSLHSLNSPETCTSSNIFEIIKKIWLLPIFHIRNPHSRWNYQYITYPDSQFNSGKALSLMAAFWIDTYKKIGNCTLTSTCWTVIFGSVVISVTKWNFSIFGQCRLLDSEVFSFLPLPKVYVQREWRQRGTFFPFFMVFG